MLKDKLLLLFFLAGLLLPFSFVSAGTVLSSYKYAWSNNVGYINFENVIVGDSALSGYAWSTTHSWIKLNPAQGGVMNNGSGNLSGYAWGEQLGWINFDNVSINTSNGKFSGTATSTLIGTLTLDCPNYCDVRTDWRPVCSVMANVSTYNAYPTCGPATCNNGYTVSGGSCVAIGGGGILNQNPTPAPTTQTANPKHVETNNQDLTINSNQSGRYAKETEKGYVVVEVPAKNVLNKTTFYITAEPLSLNNQYLVLPEVRLVNAFFYDIYAKDQGGNFIHLFPSPITITLPIPTDLQKAGNLRGAYWLNENNNQWVLIPDAVFANNKAVFQVSHLTKFAIFETAYESVSGESPKEKAKKDSDSDTNITNNLKPSLPLPAEADSKKDMGRQEKPVNLLKNNFNFFWAFLILIILIILILGYKKYRDKNKNNI